MFWLGLSSTAVEIRKAGGAGIPEHFEDVHEQHDRFPVRCLMTKGRLIGITGGFALLSYHRICPSVCSV